MNPLDQMLDSDENTNFLERLLINDMISKEQFRDIQGRIIEYVFTKAIDQIYG